MYDFHLHSDFSFDSKTPAENTIKAAIAKGFKVMCFTDHLDYDATLCHKDYYFDLDEYFLKMRELKEKYAEQIEVLIGVEFGIQPHLIEKYNKIAKENPFDFILMSIHTVEHHDLAVDGFPEKYPPLEVMQRYYTQMAECLDLYDDFDILGHLDYLDRYFKDKSTFPEFKSYKPYVETVFDKVIKKGKGIELNSAGLRRGLDFFHPKIDALKLYFEMGGDIVSFGSDAHIDRDFGFGYDEVIATAKKYGLKELSIYRNRERFAVKV